MSAGMAFQSLSADLENCGNLTTFVPFTLDTIVPFVRIVEKMLEVPFRRIEKIACHSVVLRILEGNLLDGIAVKTEKHGAGITQNNR